MVDIIHIGMHKTGSTWFQNVFFQQHPELAILGSGLSGKDIQSEYLKEVRRLVLGSDLSCDTEQFAQNIKALCEQYKQKKQKSTGEVPQIGISHEAFCGNWLTGKNSRFIAQTFAEHFPQAKIILFIREQCSMLESTYKQYIRSGGTVSFSRLLQDPLISEGKIHDDLPRNTHVVEFFKYSRLVKMYQDLFGKDNVFVGSMKQLRHEKDVLLADLCQFLGIKSFVPIEIEANIQLSPYSLRILRLLNHLFYTPQHRKYGIMLLENLLFFTIAKYQMKAWQKLEVNPYLAKQRISNRIQKRLAGQILPQFDKYLFNRLPSLPKFKFQQLPIDLQNWLINEYRQDNRILQDLVSWDLSKYHYLT